MAKKDNVRKAGNYICFATMQGDWWQPKSDSRFKVVKDTDDSTQIIVSGDAELLLQSLRESKTKFDDLAVTVRYKKLSDRKLVIDITDGLTDEEVVAS